MKFSKMTAALVLAASAVTGGIAHAAPTPTLINVDGFSPFIPFGGFDWASAAAAWTNGLPGATANFLGGGPAAGNAFSVNYAGWAVSILDTAANPISNLNLDSTANGAFNPGKSYEYTIRATINARIVGIGIDGNGLPFVDYRVLGGSFNVFYDTVGAQTANTTGGGGTVWTGFNNGTPIITGLFNSSSSIARFTDFPSTSTNNNAIHLRGVVTATNAAFVSPPLVGTEVDSVFRLAPTSGFTAPNSVDGVAINPAEDKFRADAFQLFTTLPEPSILMLAGAALLAGGLSSRRRRPE